MKCKRKYDGRKLDHKTLEALRIRTVERVLDGEDPEELARGLGMSRATVYRWMQKYHKGSWEALEARPVPGRQPRLDTKQLAWLVRALIRETLGVSLSEVSVWRLLRNLGFTPQRPKHKAHQQDEAQVAHWREEEFPALRSRARKEPPPAGVRPRWAHQQKARRKAGLSGKSAEGGPFRPPPSRNRP